MKTLYSIITLLLLTSLSSCYESTTQVEKIYTGFGDSYEKTFIYRTNKLTGEVVKMDKDLNVIKIKE